MTEPAPPAPRFRELCLQCRRVRSACWCHALRPVDPGVRVVVLQHPGEARNPIGTARMAHLSLRGSQLLQGVRFEEDPAFRALVSEPAHQLAVLYPAAHAVDAAQLARDGRPLTVIAIDGTWSEARSVWNKNPTLRTLPAVRLSPTAPSRYRIRREPEAHCLSTIEALTALLRELCGPGFDERALLRPFDAMVEHQLTFIESSHPAHRAGRHAPRAPKPVRELVVPPELTAFGRHLVLVCGESNGYSAAHADGGGQVALTQWVALRPDTGETFHALVRPANGFAPIALERMQLDEAAFEGALSPEAFSIRWRMFVEPQDVLGAWGFFSLSLLRGAGLPLPPYVNVQALVNERARRRVGKVEAGHALLCGDAPPPRFPGRAGARIELLRELVEVLRRPPVTPFAAARAAPR